MISDLPSIQVPDEFSRLCRLDLNNTRISYGEITDILQEDSFLKLYIQTAFTNYLQKGGMLGMLTALGWQGFRNRLAEAYIYKARHGSFPDEIIMDEVHDVLDIEKRFEFLTNDGNSRTFLFGFYLKLCDIFIEKEESFVGAEFITIPPELDELLIQGKSKGASPDWLIIVTWLLIEILGQSGAFDLISAAKGKFSKIASQLNEEQYDHLMSGILKYGYGISDFDFLTSTKV